ncbi:MAG: hypothetical protein IJ240_07235 [Clostridia bacterium]|nr:hypothetical protein [Clostridia bacterium]
MLYIDGLLMPAPAALTLSYEPVGRADIAADGSAVADRIAVKRRVTASWRRLTLREAQALLAAVNAAPLFDLTLFDPAEGESVTFPCRALRLAVTPGPSENGTPRWIGGAEGDFMEG